MPELTTVMVGVCHGNGLDIENLGRCEFDLDIFISEATVLTITTAAGLCIGIYVFSMDDEIGGGDEVSEDDVVKCTKVGPDIEDRAAAGGTPRSTCPARNGWVRPEAATAARSSVWRKLTHRGRVHRPA